MERVVPEGRLNPLSTLGRVLFGLPFAIFGVFHLMNGEAMAGAVPVPGGVFWVYLTGVALIAGAVGLITGILGRWAALGLAALLIVFVVTIHVPGMSNPQTAQLAMTSLLKDVSLAGGALTWAGLFAPARTRHGRGTPAATTPRTSGYVEQPAR